MISICIPNAVPKRASLFSISVLLAASASPLAWGAPIVAQLTGTLDHKASVTVIGSGFGSKATAAPLVFDDSTGTDLKAKWDGATPSLVPGYNTDYYAPMRGVNPPHSHDTSYIAGAHVGATADTGYEVSVSKNLPPTPLPFYVYASWYQRADAAWVFGGDNNYKVFSYSNCCDPYQGLNFWYTAYGPPHPSSPADTGTQWIISGATSTLVLPDLNGHSAWWSSAIAPMSGRWTKVEVTVKATNQIDGYVKVWENGRQVMAYAGPTDRFPGTSRTIGVGGYARMYGFSSNWRYFADVYVDTTLSRLVFANAPVLSQATIVENQIPTAWGDGSITATVNLGQFTRGQTAYVFVVDASGTANAAGLPVTIGDTGSSATPPSIPNAPSAIRVQ